MEGRYVGARKKAVISWAVDKKGPPQLSILEGVHVLRNRQESDINKINQV